MLIIFVIYFRFCYKFDRFYLDLLKIRVDKLIIRLLEFVNLVERNIVLNKNWLDYVSWRKIVLMVYFVMNVIEIGCL